MDDHKPPKAKISCMMADKPIYSGNYFILWEGGILMNGDEEWDKRECPPSYEPLKKFSREMMYFKPVVLDDELLEDLYQVLSLWREDKHYKKYGDSEPINA